MLMLFNSQFGSLYIKDMDNLSFDNALYIGNVYWIYLLWLDPGSHPLFRSPSLGGDIENLHYLMYNSCNSYTIKLSLRVLLLNSTRSFLEWANGGHSLAFITTFHKYSGVISVSAVGSIDYFDLWLVMFFGRLTPM